MVDSWKRGPPRIRLASARLGSAQLSLVSILLLISITYINPPPLRRTGTPPQRRHSTLPGVIPSRVVVGLMGGLYVVLVLLVGLVQLPAALAQTLAPTPAWSPGAYPRVDFTFAYISSATGYGPESTPIILANPLPNLTNVMFAQVCAWVD